MDLTILALIMSILVVIVIVTYDIKHISENINKNNKDNLFNFSKIPQAFGEFNYENLRVKDTKVYTISDKYVVITIVLMKGEEDALDEDILIPEEPQAILPLVKA